MTRQSPARMKIAMLFPAESPGVLANTQTDLNYVDEGASAGALDRHLIFGNKNDIRFRSLDL
jgi:hypothetical protein